MKTKIIGIILPGPIAYTETFFKSKIEGLIENGYKVIIFCKKKDSNILAKFDYSFQWEVSSNILIKGFQTFLGIFKCSVLRPIRVIRFLKAANRESIPIFKMAKLLYINGNILLIRSRIDVIHFGFATMGINRELLGDVFNCSLSTSLRGYDIGIFPLGKPNCYDLLWKKINKVHTISNDLLEKAHGLGLSRDIYVAKIPPAINIQNFLSPRPRAFFADKKIKILTVGRLHWKKGYEYAFLALKLLKDRGINFSYTIIGEGEDYERLMFARYQLDLEKEVSFLGKVSHAEIPKLMWENDVYLQPSVQEGFCNAVLEAQVTGMICVVSNAEGLSENVAHKVSGWVVKKRDVVEMSNTLARLVNEDEERLNLMSRLAIERVKNNFNLKLQKQLFTSFFS